MFPIPRTASLTFLLPQTLQSFIKSNLVFYVFLCFLLFFGVLFFAFFIFFEFTSPRVVLPTPSWPKPKLKKNLLVLCDKKWKNHIFILYLIILHIFAKNMNVRYFLTLFLYFPEGWETIAKSFLLFFWNILSDSRGLLTLCWWYPKPSSKIFNWQFFATK